MKNSMFNVFVPFDCERHLLFNTLFRSVAVIDNDLKEMLERGEIERGMVEERLLCGLKDLGAVKEEEMDELNFYEDMHRRWKENTDISSFIIYPTFACNLSCPYCYEKELENTKGSMNEEKIQSVLSFIKKATILNKSSRITLGFFGGEPLLEQELCFRIAKEIYAWCEERGIKYYGTLTSNGTLLAEDTLERLGRYISSVQFTIDGYNESHDAKRFFKDGRGTYEIVMAATSRFLQTGKQVALRIHITEDLLNLRELFEDIKRRGFDMNSNFHFYFSLTAPSNACINFHREELFLESLKNAHKLMPLARAIATDAGLRHCLDAEKSLGETVGLSCDYLKEGMHMIDPRGDVYHCPVFTGQKEYSLGTIEADGEVCWTKVYYDLMDRNPAAISGCKSCPLLPLCAGGCPISAKMRNGTFNSCGCADAWSSIEGIKASIKNYFMETEGWYGS
ncbi:MAG: pyrroloquinoline quinone biosynthesis protein PqqE [Methanosaeta sp. PtaU1.Bin112]|nr:MAG: pyrroloquinoline quinone biosynthesis protein PqqE [Methanosaeta sp. PtaU1.Bin112]